MKIPPKHVETAREAVVKLLESHQTPVLLQREALRANPQIKDWEKSLRWRVLWGAIDLRLLPASWITEVYACGCNDEHIDTLLRQVFQPLIRALTPSTEKP